MWSAWGQTSIIFFWLLSLFSQKKRLFSSSTKLTLLSLRAKSMFKSNNSSFFMTDSCSVTHFSPKGATENTIKRCFLLPETRMGRLIPGTTRLLLSTAASSLHPAWHHVSSLNFVYPSRAAPPAWYLYPDVWTRPSSAPVGSPGCLASDNKRQERLREDSSRIFQQFV